MYFPSLFIKKIPLLNNPFKYQHEFELTLRRIEKLYNPSKSIVSLHLTFSRDVYAEQKRYQYPYRIDRMLDLFQYLREIVNKADKINEPLKGRNRFDTSSLDIIGSHRSIKILKNIMTQNNKLSESGNKIYPYNIRLWKLDGKRFYIETDEISRTYVNLVAVDDPKKNSYLSEYLIIKFTKPNPLEILAPNIVWVNFTTHII